ncbi:MAG: hypothetical protein ABIR19_04190 [Ginsengibacter sp.]
MPKRKSVLVWLVFCLMLFIATSDGIRYLRPDGLKEKVQLKGEAAEINNPVKIVLAYDSWGGIVPGAIDYFHQIFFPSTYSCKLCKLSHGTIGMKKVWKRFLDSLPYKKIYLYKDEVQKKFLPVDISLPAIFLSDSTQTILLVNANEIDNAYSVENLITLVKNKLPQK